MMNASMKTIAAWACAAMLVVLATAIGSPTPAAAQERFGALAGVVKDSSGAILPGVTVTVTNKVTQRVYTAVSGSDGSYRVLDLEPGRYGVRFELSGFATSDVADVNVLLGKSLDVSPSMKVGGVTEAITVTTESPLIDTKSTTIAHNVTAEELDRIPKGRTFQNIAISSPSVNAGDIEGGIQVNGASGAENSFTVDGVVTNSLVDGRSRQDAVFEYLQEVQVKTGGISAEYGGALGGVVSAVTKSGGNTFHGEGHYYFGGSSLSASPVKRLVLDTADDQTVALLPGSQAGGTSARHRRIDRRADREEQAVLLRLAVAALRPPHERLPVQRRHRSRRDRSEADVHERVREGELRPDGAGAHELLVSHDAHNLHRASCRRMTDPDRRG